MNDPHILAALIAARKLEEQTKCIENGTIYVDHEAAIQSLWDNTTGYNENNIQIGKPDLGFSNHPKVDEILEKLKGELG
jgi:hypothetical protein